jgi:hypothetical protein
MTAATAAQNFMKSRRETSPLARHASAQPFPSPLRHVISSPLRKSKKYPENNRMTCTAISNPVPNVFEKYILSCFCISKKSLMQ